MGPGGVDKILVDSEGLVTVTNDGATVLKLCKVTHDVSNILVDMALAQDFEVGDGTTTVVLLASSIIKEYNSMCRRGVHPVIVGRTFRHICRLAVNRLRELSLHFGIVRKVESRVYLDECARSSICGKLACTESSFFTRVVVDVMSRMPRHSVNLSLVGFSRVANGDLGESVLIDGVGFPRAFTYAGFENQPKFIDSPFVLLLNLELELRASSEHSEVRVTDPARYQILVDAEWDCLKNLLDRCINTGARVVLSRLSVGDLATQYFSDNSIFSSGRVEDQDLKRLACCCGAQVVSSIYGICRGELGRCRHFEENFVGGQRFSLFAGCPGAPASTVLIRGGSSQFIDEVLRSLLDSMMALANVFKKSCVIAGGGAAEIEIYRLLNGMGVNSQSDQRYFFSSYASIFKSIPRQLCDNSGFDFLSVLDFISCVHRKGDCEGRNLTVDMNKVYGAVRACCIWEPTKVKINAYQSSFEAVSVILSVD